MQAEIEKNLQLVESLFEYCYVSHKNGPENNDESGKQNHVSESKKKSKKK